MSSNARGGRYLETAHINHSKPKANIGSKFPALGAVHPERDDCAPPLLVCGRCPLCQKTAARRLANLALAEHQFEYDGTRLRPLHEVEALRVEALRTSLLALGILAEDGTEGPQDSSNSEPTTEETAA